MVAQMVSPIWVSFFTTVMTSLAVKESRPEVGSSRNSTFGSDTSAIPMLVRLHCPPVCTRQHVSTHSDSSFLRAVHGHASRTET